MTPAPRLYLRGRAGLDDDVPQEAYQFFKRVLGNAFVIAVRAKSTVDLIQRPYWPDAVALGALCINYVFKRQDLYESCDIKYRLFLNALELLTGHLLTGSTTRSVYHLHGRVRSHVPVEVIRNCVFSRKDLNLFKRATSCTPGIMPIHLKRFLKRGLEVFQ